LRTLKADTDLRSMATCDHRRICAKVYLNGAVGEDELGTVAVEMAEKKKGPSIVTFKYESKRSGSWMKKG